MSRVLLVTFFAAIDAIAAKATTAQPQARRNVQDTEACTDADGAPQCFITIGGVRNLADESSLIITLSYGTGKCTARVQKNGRPTVT